MVKKPCDATDLKLNSSSRVLEMSEGIIISLIGVELLLLLLSCLPRLDPAELSLVTYYL